MYDIRTVRHNVCIWRFVFLNVPNHVRGNLVQPCAQIGRHKPYADLVRAPCLVQGLVDLVRALCLTTLCVPCACLCVTLCATLPPAQGVRTLCANQLSAQAMLTLCATQRRAQGLAQGTLKCKPPYRKIGTGPSGRSGRSERSERTGPQAAPLWAVVLLGFGTLLGLRPPRLPT